MTTRVDSARAGVTLRAVSKAFGPDLVLDGVDLQLAEGRITALMGPNGAGKTTVGRLLLGLGHPDAGRIDGLAGRRRAAVFQEDRLCEHLSAIDNVRLVLGRSDESRASRDLGQVGLDARAQAKPVRKLSGGQRRRVAIVRAMASDADLVVLDEPFTGVDAESKPTLMGYVRDRAHGRTILLITHDASEALFLDAAVVCLPPRGHGTVIDTVDLVNGLVSAAKEHA